MSLCMAERSGVAIPYSVPAMGHARTVAAGSDYRRRHTGRERPSGAARRKADRRKPGGRSRPDSSCCSCRPAAQSAAGLSACAACKLQ